MKAGNRVVVAVGVASFLLINAGCFARTRKVVADATTATAGSVAATVEAQAMPLYKKIGEAAGKLKPADARAMVLDGVDQLYALVKNTGSQCDSLRQAKDAVVSELASVKTNLDSLKAANQTELQVTQAKLVEINKKKEAVEKDLKAAQAQVKLLTDQLKHGAQAQQETTKPAAPAASNDKKTAELISSLLQGQTNSARDNKPVSEHDKQQLIKALQDLHSSSTGQQGK